MTNELEQADQASLSSNSAKNAKTEKTTKAKKTKKAKKPNRGWVPNYHGAWAMITIPIILGIVLTGFKLEHILLLAFWWEGYFAYFAVSQWLHFRRRADFLPAAKFYSIVLVPLGIALALVAPYLLWWFLLYIPIMFISIWAAKTRQDRHLLNDTASVVASGLTLLIAFDLGTTGAKFSLFSDTSIFGLGWLIPQLEVGLDSLNGAWLLAWIWTMFVTAYFMGTVFYVKTLTRGRKSNLDLAISAIFHIGFTILAWYFYAKGTLNLSLFIFWIALSIRSLFSPLYGRKYGWISIKTIGIAEIVFSALAFITLLV